MAAFPLLSGFFITQFPYGETDLSPTIRDETAAGFVTVSLIKLATDFLGNAARNQLRCIVRFPNINDTDKAALEAFFNDMAGRLGSFTFTDDAGNAHATCRFDQDDLNFEYKAVGLSSVELAILCLD
jgi:hypothetical protein